MNYADILIYAVTITVALLSVVSLLITTMNRRRDNRFRNEIVHLDEMRRYYESKIYDLNEKLTYNSQRWQDVNHLFLSKNDVAPPAEAKKIDRLTKFLQSHGLSEGDLSIDKKSVFVLTPFLEPKNSVYAVVRQTCKNAGLQCSRGDDEFIRGDILPFILKKIVQARIVVANIDGRNPNVFYELGIAHALDKPTILIAKSLDDAPFDLQSKHIILYKDFGDLNKKLTSALTRAVLEIDD